MMQMFGAENPFITTKKRSQDILVHAAEIPNQNMKGHFEFTFYKRARSHVLYHRFFKKTGKLQDAKAKRRNVTPARTQRRVPHAAAVDPSSVASCSSKK
jgi:hypothetical protein